MPPPLVALIGGLASLMGTGLNLGIAARQNKKQRDFDRNQAEIAYNRDIQQWNRANEYNSPAKQMERFTEAGLNKNLIYSQGQPGMAQSTTPQYHAVKGQYGLPKLEIANAVNMYQSLQNQAETINLLKQKTENTAWDVGLKQALHEYLAGNYSLDSDGQMTYKPGMYKYQKDAIQKDLEIKDKVIMQKGQQIGLTTKELEWFDERLKTFRSTGIDISRDSPFWRILVKVLPILHSVVNE